MGIEITCQAQEQLRKLIDEAGDEETAGIRLSARGGACRKIEYMINLVGVEAVSEHDMVVHYPGLNIYIDPISNIKLSGMILNFTNDFMNRRFSFQQAMDQ